jgi:hypothetical protein
MSYMHVLCLYMHVFPGMTPKTRETMPRPRNTISRGGNRRATLGHLSIHFFSPSANVVQTRFGAPRPAARVQGPWSVPAVGRWEVSNARSRHYNPVPWPVTADLVGWSPSRRPRASAAPPQKHLLTAIRWCQYMSVYVCICKYIQYMYAYVCICMYIYPCPGQCYYMYVYVCICMYNPTCM